jgi:transcription elongation factor GreB
LRSGRPLSKFLCLPGNGLRGGIAGGGIAEHMRMPTYHLVGDAFRDIGKCELSGFLGHARVVDHLEQQVAEFVRKRREITLRDRIDDLIGFFDGIGSDGVEGLGLVPGTSGGGVAQRGHDVQQAAKFGFGRGGGIGHTTRVGERPAGRKTFVRGGQTAIDGTMEYDDGDAPPALPGGKFYMTPAGHVRLRAELAQRRSERHRTVEIVAWAASNGDRSENADYKEGKRRLREIDRRLRFLMNRIAHAEVVDPAEQAQRDRVFFGATVTYANERDEEVTVTIVGVDEADMAAGKISIGSPVALALLRARRGDEVTVRTPRGPEVLEVVEIQYPTRQLGAAGLTEP